MLVALQLIKRPKRSDPTILNDGYPVCKLQKVQCMRHQHSSLVLAGTLDNLLKNFLSNVSIKR